MTFLKNASFLAIFALLGKSLPAQALTVMSDIDDTIKISDVGNLGDAAYRELKLRQFVGMSQTYQGVAAHTNATFIYLSGGSEELGFIDDHFLTKYDYPAGDLILKNLSQWNEDVGAYKLAHLKQIFAASTDHFILIGDDTEKDFLSYAEISKEYPGRVNQIYIHAIRGITLPAVSQAAHEITYLTAFDLAMHLYENQNLNLAGLANTAKAIENQPINHDDQVIANFQTCPKNYTAVVSNDPDANAVAELVTPKILAICRARDRSF